MVLGGMGQRPWSSLAFVTRMASALAYCLSHEIFGCAASAHGTRTCDTLAGRRSYGPQAKAHAEALGRVADVLQCTLSRAIRSAVARLQK